MMEANETLSKVLAYCAEHEADPEFAAYAMKLKRYAVDQDTLEQVAAGKTDDSWVMEPEENLTQVQVYLETQGERFPRHAETLLKLTGPSGCGD